MKLKYAHIENSIGIYISMGLKSIDLDFTTGDTLFNIIKGPSGSGKSTIQSLLTVFPFPVRSRMDKNKGLNVPGQKMVKELTYDTHKVRSVYTDKASSHYFAEWVPRVNKYVERNSSGTLSGYRDCLKTYLGITEDYRPIIEMSTETVTFIDSTPQDRKKLISQILPSVDGYTGPHEEANRQLQVMRKEKRRLAANAAAIGDKKVLESRREILQKDLSLSEVALAEGHQQLGRVEGIIESLPGNIKDINIIQIQREHDTLMNEIMGTLKIYGYDNIQQLSKEDILKQKSDLEPAYNEAKDNHISASSALRGAMNQKSITEQEIQNLQRELNGLTSIDNKELMSKLDNARNTALQCKGIVGGRVVTDPKGDLEKARAKQSKYQSMESQYGALSYGYEFLPSGETFDSFRLKLIDEGKSMNAQLEDISGKISEYERAAKSIDGDLNSFNKEPICDTCPMFASFKGALAHKGRIMEYRNEKIELTKKLDAARELISNVIQPAIKAAEIYDQTIGLGAYTDHKKTLAMITDEIEFLIAYNRMIEAEAEAKYLESTLDKDAVAASLNAKISTLTKEVASSTQRIEELRGTSQSATERFNTLNEQNRKLDTLHGLFATLDRIDELDKKIEACESFKTVMVTLSEAKENIEKVGRDVNSIKNEISTLDYKIVQLGEVSLSLDKINYAMAKYDEIKMAASPITGVPSIAIDGFLDQSIKDDINTFLGHFFDGALRLVKFEVGDNTFDIVVTGGEKPMERDISRCSKSERRTTGLALSLALLKRSFTTDVKYNIVSMDEMDDGLDVMKKQIFFSILQNYFMENNSISQVFMSTHNPAVENTDSSFVLLKNSGVETQNIRPNRIIFNYSA